jgi:hypothetical protein
MDSHKIARRVTVTDEYGDLLLVGPPWKIVAMFGSSIFWHNDATGEGQFWVIEGLRLRRRLTLVGQDGNPVWVGLPWSVVGSCVTGHPHLLAHNASTHETQQWLISTAQISGSRTVVFEDDTPALVGPPWNIVGSWWHITWHNSATNETQLWFMENHKVKFRRTVLGEDAKPALVGPPWKIVAVVPFNPRVPGQLPLGGSEDILWHNDTTGETQIWLMDSPSQNHKVAARSTVIGEDGNPAFVGPPWEIVGATIFR